MSAADLPALRELQSLCWRLIAHPEGAAVGAVALVREGALASPDLAGLVRADERLDAVGRLDVYADMYFYRLRDCLAEDYPKLLAWLGPARFHNLVTDYLIAHPSSHFSLRELGRALPDFLAAHPLESERPGVAGLASLEWARVDVFDERDAPPLDRAVLLARGAADAEGFRAALVPAVRRLALPPAALARWREPEVDPGSPSAAAPVVPVHVWRRDFAVYHRPLAPDEAHCLDALAERPLTLGELGAALAAALPADTDPARAGARLAELLETWTRDALLAEAPA